MPSHALAAVTPEKSSPSLLIDKVLTLWKLLRNALRSRQSNGRATTLAYHSS